MNRPRPMSGHELLANRPYRAYVPVHLAVDARIFHRQSRSLAKSQYNVVLFVPYPNDEVVLGVRIRAVLQEKNRWKRRTRTVCQVSRRAVALRAAVYQFHDRELVSVGWLLK